MDAQYEEKDLLIFCRAMANVAASDGRVTDEERDQLEDTVLGLGLSPNDPKVRAVLDAEFKAPGSLHDIVKDLQHRELRIALVRMLVEVACADGVLQVQEREKVREACRAFGFDVTLIDALVEWTLDSIALEAREKAIMDRFLA
jgi:uncharacterized membrane protein YebE (DUF533 family)